MTTKELGRPPVYSTAEELSLKIEEFFEAPPTRKVVTNGVPVDMPVITMSGLAFHLGFASRQSLYDYEKNEDFSYIIKRARLFIESEYEGRLHQSNPTGSIFALKNMGWSDKQELEVSSTDDMTKMKEIEDLLSEHGIDPKSI